MREALSSSALRKITESVKFWPGWQIEVYETEFQGIVCAISAEVEDYAKPGQKVTLRVKSILPPFYEFHQFLEWLRWRLERIAVHEVHEGLRWTGSGKPVYDPHSPNADEPAE